jgi:hypothetical protein
MQPVKDPARYSGPAPTLVNAEKATEQTAMVETEAPAASAKPADAPAADDADARAHASHTKGKTARTHTASRYRQRSPGLGDIFRQSRYR